MNSFAPRPILILTALAVTGALGCSDREAEADRSSNPEPALAANDIGACDDAAGAVAKQFGERLKLVSITAPDSIIVREIQENYGPLVTSALLARWVASPGDAPGREVSSPWPEQIDVQSVEPVMDGCRVNGEVVYVTSVEATGGGEAARVPISIVLRSENGWRIDDYASGGSPSGTSPADR